MCGNLLSLSFDCSLHSHSNCCKPLNDTTLTSLSRWLTHFLIDWEKQNQQTGVWSSLLHLYPSPTLPHISPLEWVPMAGLQPLICAMDLLTFSFLWKSWPHWNQKSVPWHLLQQGVILSLKMLSRAGLPSGAAVFSLAVPSHRQTCPRSTHTAPTSS